VSEWNSGYFNGSNGEWLNELSAGGNIGNRRNRRGTLRYGDFVLIADCVRVIVC
jgi:ABC-type phosphonate transport system ATPase subunit